MPDLRDRLISALRDLSPQQGGIVSLTLAAPGLHLDQPPLGTEDYCFWGRPAEEHYRLGLGRLPFDPAWRWLDVDETGCLPMAWVTSAFDPDAPMSAPWDGLPSKELLVPEILLERRGPRRAITFTCRAGGLADPEALADRWAGMAGGLILDLSAAAALAPCEMTLAREEESPAAESWVGRVRAALAEIEAGELEKLVLTRRVTLRGERPFEAAAVMASLRCLYPGCTLLALRRGDRTLVAASPERLATLSNGEVNTIALAGSARRSPVPERDRALAAELLADTKQRREHRLVVDAIVSALDPLCAGLDWPKVPELMALRTLHHLQTPIRGRAASGVSLLRIAAHLHPTPAVSGWPREAALSKIRESAEAERGWYSGYCGWVDTHGEGEFTVILRCALLEGERAHLFAGCGIVAGSEPDAELAETEWKLAALMPALENG